MGHLRVAHRQLTRGNPRFPHEAPPSGCGRMPVVLRRERGLARAAGGRSSTSEAGGIWLRVVSCGGRRRVEAFTSQPSTTAATGRAPCVDDLAHWIELLGLAPAVVIGQSLGGHTAVLLAARR